MPLVSAIIPTYNRAALLTRALASVAEQDYRPIEAVVVDDGSTDNTMEMLAGQKPLLAERGIELVAIRQANGRSPKARNTAMKAARGQLFAFLDSDDLWRPTFVSTLLRMLEKHPGAGLAFSAVAVIDEADNVLRVRDSRLPPEPREAVLPRPFDQIVRYMPIQTSGVMVRRRVIDEVGDFDLDLPVGEDWDLWYRTGKRYDFAYTVEPLACNRVHGQNIPKSDSTALASNLRLNLRHLPDVHDPGSREILAGRIRKQILMLQEQLLRENRSADGLTQFLRHELAPRGLRYRVGGVMLHAPGPVGRLYAGIVRGLGKLCRGGTGQ